MTDPLDAIGLPTTTVMKPTGDNFGYMTVTAGPSRGTTSISLPVGVSLIVLDFAVHTGSFRGQLRGSIDGSAKFLSSLADYTGTSTEIISLVNDDPEAWIGVYGLPSGGAFAETRVGVTIYPMLAV